MGNVLLTEIVKVSMFFATENLSQNISGYAQIFYQHHAIHRNKKHQTTNKTLSISLLFKGTVPCLLKFFYYCIYDSEILHTNRKRNSKTYLFVPIFRFDAYNFFFFFFVFLKN